jgi:hypothetical protein
MQKQYSPLAAGKKVYVSGSYAPSTGPNKRQGYIKREQRRKNNKRMKRAMRPSQMLAQQALKYKLRRLG